MAIRRRGKHAKRQSPPSILDLVTNGDMESITDADAATAQESFEHVCRKMTPGMVRKASIIVKGGKGARNAQSVIKLFEMILAYGYGKPKQSVKLLGGGRASDALQEYEAWKRAQVSDVE